MIGYGTTKADAVRAFTDGLPSLLPDANRWKSLVEAHRWGWHGASYGRHHSCPVCIGGDA